MKETRRRSGRGQAIGVVDCRSPGLARLTVLEEICLEGRSLLHGFGSCCIAIFVDLGEDKREGELHPAVAGEFGRAMLEPIKTFLLGAEVLAPASFDESGRAYSELLRECRGGRVWRA